MGQFVHCMPARRPGREEEESSGYCAGRGETAPQGDDVVGRLRRRPRKPRVPDRRARLVDRCARHDGRVPALDDLDLPGRAAEQHPRRARVHVPEQVGRRRPVRARGVAQVPDAHRPAGDVRVLDRLVGRALRERPRRRHAAAERVLLEVDVDALGRRLHPHAPGRPRLRADPRRVAVQHLRRPPRGVVRLRHGRAAVPPGLRAHVPAVRHGRLAQLEHDVVDRLRRRPPADPRLAVLHVLVGVRHRGGRDVRARVPRHRARHAQGAALVGALLRGGLRAAASSPGSCSR
jgi:hypothetical protein